MISSIASTLQRRLISVAGASIIFGVGSRLGLVVAVVLLVVPIAEARPGPTQLLACYEPVAILHPEELFHPSGSTGFSATPRSSSG